MSTIQKAMENLQAKEGNQTEKQQEDAREQGLFSEEECEGDLAPSSQTPVQNPPQTKVDSPPKTTPKIQEQNDQKKPIIELNLNLMAQKGFITSNSENRAISEQYRAIKRKLLNNAFGPLASSLNRPNLIIVTSSNPNEGKTFSSINLALSIALEKDKTVLLVDSDVLKPSLCKELDIPDQPGIMEYLSGDVAEAADIISSTNIDNLKFISSGEPHHLSTELLASARMTKLVEELATRYPDRVVIFDAPPLLGVNETHIMANLVGQAVVVVEEGKTKVNDVNNAVAQLDPDLAIGFVVNKATQSLTGGYGYGYGYGYGSK